ncbi:oxidoreductase [Mucilaginibacter sp. PPCGB 2223]|uniref:Gfo/Idh/MocA family oxidoreductase n=1 Tax=Mucilaginibacter sp. PPCGB 2223 TaxID=1886027 RepID=UPI000826B8BB|nr:Gfo/Idh/MocA family oxidoreductase [Mucilaginibacter sp. PPCGB 2223]OCX50789.1 oxidoreductase [Mucilaginibacter sp. PPCGB 2223]
MSKPIIAGIMSYGMSGRIFQAPFLEAHPGFRLKAVTERSKKTAVQRYPDIISYDSIDELLNDAEIELIAVNTPGNTHYDFAKRALQAGKHVLVEKPAAATAAEVKELHDLGRAQGKQVFIYQNRRWDSDFQSFKQIIESGKLGKLIEVTLRFDRYNPVLSPKVFKEAANTQANGLVYDLGPHVLDQAISLFGKPLRFTKVTGRNRPGTLVDDYFFFQLSYPDQLNVLVAGSLLTAQPMPAFVAHGTLGSYLKDRVDVQEAQLDKNMLPTDAAYGIEPPGSEAKLITFAADGSKQIQIIPPVKGDYMGLFEAVYQAIRNNKPYPITEENILAQVELLESRNS